MNIISVKASGQYDVIIGADLLSQTGKYLKEITGCDKAAIISDSHVWPIYGKVVAEAIEKSGISPYTYIFPAGEGSKTAQTYFEILNFLAENKITRSDAVIALGGGVVGDITGFAAATYLRGISYIQIPTSLLAMVDSSVGGKTAIDLPAGKNLAGAFKQPKLVLCDVDTLHTLPREQFLDGCAEVIKYGMLYDADLLDYLDETGPNFNLQDVITKCVVWKRDVVQEDEFDTGPRQKLNFGHTIGHGIEAASKYTITHGQAVAAGMAIVSRAAVSSSLCERAVSVKLQSVLDKFSLPVNTEYSAEVLFQCALSDKKRSGGNVNIIVPRQIGHCDIHSIPVSDLESFIEAGL